MKIVGLYIDTDPSDPMEGDAWETVSFNNRHRNFQYPEKYLSARNTFQQKLNEGTAFVLSCYQHGGIAWSLKGEGMQCQWDTAQVAGLLIWNGVPTDIGKTYEARTEQARNFLSVYNQWCNGEVYGFSVLDVVTAECGHKERRIIDSCWGFYSVDDMAVEVRAAVGGDPDVQFEGDAQLLCNCYDFVSPIDTETKDA